MATTQQQYFECKGGYDIVTPPNKLRPGTVISAKNYEQAINGGYARIEGDEVFDGLPSPSAASTTADQEVRRLAIGPVPGSGDVLGIHQFNGEKYAFRNDGSGNALMYVAHPTTGWTLQTMGGGLAFTSGSEQIVVGDTIVGATNGATAVVKMITFTSGTWAAGSYAGTLWVTPVSGTFISEELDISGGASDVATITGDVVLTTLAPDGNYEFLNHNFYGASDWEWMLWCNGSDKAHFFRDGVVGILTATGMTVDTPNHMAVYKNRWYLSFPGGSIQYSSAIDPTLWSGVLGAGEIGLGDECTKLEVLTDGTLGMFTRNKTWILPDDPSVSGVAPKQYSEESGCIEDTFQKFEDPIYLDDRGLTTLKSTQYAGDFKGNIIGRQVEPIIETKKALVAKTMRVKKKNQYRIFFTDNSAMYYTLENNQVVAAMPVKLNNTVTCVHSGEDSTGTERLFYGSDDGYVYELDSGTNMNGDPLNAYFRLAYNSAGSSGKNKRWRHLTLEMDLNNNPTTIEVKVSFNFEGVETPTTDSIPGSLVGGGGFIGDAVIGEFIIGGQITGEFDAYIDGVGKTMSILLTSNTTYEQSHTVYGVTVDYATLNRRR